MPFLSRLLKGPIEKKQIQKEQKKYHECQGVQSNWSQLDKWYRIKGFATVSLEETKGSAKHS